MAVFSGSYWRHREMEEFLAWEVSGGTGVNGLTKGNYPKLIALFLVLILC